MDKVVNLVEQFNKEFPNGDSLELAQYIYAKAKEEQELANGVIEAHPTFDIESVSINLSKYPKAFANKLDELMETGAFDNRDEAKKWLTETPIVLELYYEKDQGLFAVESEALENCGVGDIVSPYSKKPIVTNDD